MANRRIACGLPVCSLASLFLTACAGFRDRQATRMAERALGQDLAGGYHRMLSGYTSELLTLKPDLTFSKELFYDFGGAEGVDGRIVVGTGRLWLVPETSWTRDWKSSKRSSTRLSRVEPQESAAWIPIRWGERRLLIPAPLLTDFCRQPTMDNPQDCNKAREWSCPDPVDCPCPYWVGRKAQGVSSPEEQPTGLDGDPLCP
jgi:hypothetical protein